MADTGKENDPVVANDSHAGELETSMMLFLSQAQVKGRAPEEYPKLQYFQRIGSSDPSEQLQPIQDRSARMYSW